MHTHSSVSHSALRAPLRVNYYYGQLLDAYHFNLETGYQNAKRWLLNRLVLGRGVVCGLGVRRGECEDEIIVEPGVAIDGWGREVIVPEPKCMRVRPDDVIGDDRCEHHRQRHDHWATLWLCYHECLAYPSPVVTSECDTERCTPGAIRESYRLELRSGRVETCALPDPDDLVVEGQIRHRDLVEWISRCCDAPPEDPCIPLASIRVWHHEGRCGCEDADVDILVRPIVFTNRLLAMLVMGQHAGNRTSRPRY